VHNRRSFSLPLGVPVDALLMVLVWTVVACVLGTVNADPDLWGHLRFGLDMLREGHLSSVDPYSFTQDVPWVNHEWLSELQMGVAYRLGGIPGLWILRTAVFGAACAVLTRQLRSVPVLPRTAVILVTMWAAAPIATMLRPQVWSYTAAAIVATLLTASTPSRRLLWLPAVFLLWVNMHGGWIVGGLLVAIWTAMRLREPHWRWWVIAISLLCAVATLINPYGPGMWWFLLRTVRIGRDAQEWQPLTAAPLRDWWPWLATVMTPLILLTRRQRIELHRLLTIVVLAYLSFRVVRLIPLFTVVTAIYLAPALSAFAQRVTWLSRHPMAPTRVAAAFFLIPSAVVAWVAFPVSAASCFPVRGTWIPEPVTARSLQMANPYGKLVTEFGWGEYAIWHFGPRLLVSMDGRRETVYSDATLSRYDMMMEADPLAVQLLVKERPEFVWATSARTRLRSWLLQHDYRIDVETNSAWLAVRADRPAVSKALAGLTQCFPA
jgi:hypothetical protein